MASVEVSKLSAQEVSQLALTYASLILYDDGQDITGEKLALLVKSAGVKVESYWPKIFAKSVTGATLSSFFNFGGSAPADTTTSSAPAPVQEKKTDAKKETKKPVKEEPKEEPEEEGMGGLFD